MAQHRSSQHQSPWAAPPNQAYNAHWHGSSNNNQDIRWGNDGHHGSSWGGKGRECSWDRKGGQDSSWSSNGGHHDRSWGIEGRQGSGWGGGNGSSWGSKGGHHDRGTGSEGKSNNSRGHHESAVGILAGGQDRLQTQANMGIKRKRASEDPRKSVSMSWKDIGAQQKERKRQEQEMPRLSASCMDGVMQWAAEVWPQRTLERDWSKTEHISERICLDVNQILKRYCTWSKVHGTSAIPQREMLQRTLDWLVSSHGGSSDQNRGRLPIRVQKQGQGGGAKWSMHVDRDKGSYSHFYEEMLTEKLCCTCGVTSMQFSAEQRQNVEGHRQCSNCILGAKAADVAKPLECVGCGKITTEFSINQRSKSQAERRCCSCVSTRRKPKNGNPGQYAQNMPARGQHHIHEVQWDSMTSGVCVFPDIELHSARADLPEVFAAIARRGVDDCIQFGVCATATSACPLMIEWGDAACKLMEFEKRASKNLSEPLGVEVLQRYFGQHFQLLASETALADDADFCCSVGAQHLGVDVTLAVGKYEHTTGGFGPPTVKGLEKQLDKKLMKARNVAARRGWRAVLFIWARDKEAAELAKQVASSRAATEVNGIVTGVLTLIAWSDAAVLRVATQSFVQQ